MQFSAQVWYPEAPYQFKVRDFRPCREPLLIYEAHIGMATNEERVGTYDEFRIIYLNHGLGQNFTSYADYYNLNEDGEAICYLTLANQLIHEVNPNAIAVESGRNVLDAAEQTHGGEDDLIRREP